MSAREIKRIRITQLPRPNTEKDLDRRQFILVGIVEKKSISSISVSIGEDTSNYWLEFPKDSEEFVIGGKYRFEVIITTYEAKDGVIKTKFRIIEAKQIADDELEPAFIPVHLPVNILSSTRTDNPRTFILEAQRMVGEEPKETYLVRWYNEENQQHPDIGLCTIKFTIKKSKYLIKRDGATFIDTEHWVDTQDGVETKGESIVYIPCLSVEEITR